MISIIVSSYKQDYFRNFTKNIAETIGNIAYEIIQISNPGKMGICEAYNLGAQKSKFKYLLFVHEDVCFKTRNWGTLLLNHFGSISNIGVLGLAGSQYKPKILSGWYISDTNYLRLNYYQAKSNQDFQPLKHYYNPNDKSFEPVVTLDGFFMAVKKKVWRLFPFDESLKGFHGYDLEFTLAVNDKLTNVVVFDIDVVHFSPGYVNKEWLENHLAIHRKQNKKLPVWVVDIPVVRKRNIERTTLLAFLGVMENVQLGVWDKLKSFIVELLRTKGEGVTPNAILYFFKSIFISFKTLLK